MAEYETRLLNKKEVAEGTLAFLVAKPQNFEFRAGQTADLTLLHPTETDESGNTRTFSIASPPSENALLFATRLRQSAFKRSLRNCTIGTKMKLEGPAGSFTLHKNVAKPAIFLAGGIGITPFMSMIADSDLQKTGHRIHLFYSNRRPEDTAFLDQLEDVARRNANFRFIATMTEMGKSKQQWNGERGFIDAQMLKRHLPDHNGGIYYIAGPPAMVAAMREMLIKAGVDEDDIRAEDFAGY